MSVGKLKNVRTHTQRFSISKSSERVRADTIPRMEKARIRRLRDGEVRKKKWQYVREHLGGTAAPPPRQLIW